MPTRTESAATKWLATRDKLLSKETELVLALRDRDQGVDKADGLRKEIGLLREEMDELRKEALQGWRDNGPPCPRSGG